MIITSFDRHDRGEPVVCHPWAPGLCIAHATKGKSIARTIRRSLGLSIYLLGLTAIVWCGLLGPRVSFLVFVFPSDHTLSHSIHMQSSLTNNLCTQWTHLFFLFFVFYLDFFFSANFLPIIFHCLFAMLW